MRGLLLALVTVLSFVPAVHAETGFGINCDFDTDSSYIERSLADWAGSGAGGIEVRSEEEGKSVLQNVISTGDIFKVLVSKTALTLSNPKVIFVIKDEKPGTEYPYRACALIQGDVLNRFPVTVTKQ